MSVTRSLTFLWTPWTAAPLGRRGPRDGRLRLHRLAASRLSPLDGAAGAAAAGHRRPGCRAAQPARVDRGIPPRGEADDRRPDRRLAQHGDPRRRRGRPEVVLGHDPHPGDGGHDRSRVVGQAATADERGDPAVLLDDGGRRAAAAAASPANGGTGTAKAEGDRRPRDGRARHRPVRAARPGARADRQPAGDRAGTDGDWNEGPPPVQAAARLRIKGVPVLRRAGGEPHPAARRRAAEPRRPTFGIAGKSVRIPFTIDSSLPREYVTTVTLRTSDGDEVTKEVRIAPMGRTSDWLLWKPQGDRRLSR